MSERMGANQLHPLEIESAREAAHKASEKQRDVEDELRQASRDLAAAERAYRRKLSERMVELKAAGLAITACADVARGEPEVSDLRYERDVAEGVLEAMRQQAFRRGADRKDVHQLLVWSERRDLRTDAPPAQEPTPIGAGRPRSAA
jgi:hypothetical protein